MAHPLLDAGFDPVYASLVRDPHAFVEEVRACIRELRGGSPSDGDVGHVIARLAFEKLPDGRKAFLTLRDSITDRVNTGGGSTGGGPVVQPGPGNETPLSLGYVAYHANELTIGATINDAAGIRFARPAGDSALGKVSFNEERIDSRQGDRKFIERCLIIGSEGDMTFHVSDGQGGDDRNMRKALTLRAHNAEFHVPVNVPGSGGGGGPVMTEDGELYRFDKQFAEGGHVGRMTTLHFIPRGNPLAVEGAIGVGPGNSDMVDYANGNKTWRQIIVGCARRALPMGIEPPK